jgi:hypothetical protein
MFWRWLETIRQKPKSTRDQYAFGAALTFTALVVAVWGFSLPARFSDTPDGESANAPFAGLFSQMSAGLGSIRNQVAGVLEDQVDATVATMSTTSDALPDAVDVWSGSGTGTEASALPEGADFVEIRVATSAPVVTATSSGD